VVRPGTFSGTPRDNGTAGLMRTDPVSLCLIVKNEEVNLPACLTPLVDLVDEIVVTDTGSTDRTRDVATSFGARVFDFPWTQSFAAARNACLQHASGPWTLWIDADDRVDETNRARLRALLDRLGPDDLAFSIRNRLVWPSGRFTMAQHIRLVRKSPELHWKYRVHEQVMLGDEFMGKRARDSGVEFHHTGYAEAVHKRKKEERNIGLLELELLDHPDDPFIVFNLGWGLFLLKRPTEALPYLQKAARITTTRFSFADMVHVRLMWTYDMLGQTGEALRVCREGQRLFPNHPQLIEYERRAAQSPWSMQVDARPQ
jgi:glycosyltransferase involved in cell wall biosynthesis